MSYLIFNNNFRETNIFLEKKISNPRTIIKEIIESDKITDSVIIVPTKRVVRYLTNRIIKEYFSIHKKPIRKLKIFNLEDFAKRIFETAILSPEFIELLEKVTNSSQTEKPIFISEALRLILIEEAFQKADLTYYKFTKNKVRLEVIRKLSDLIYGLREDGFDCEQAQRELNVDISEKYDITDVRKSSDSLKLIIEYEKLLTGGLYDSPKMFSNLNKFLKSVDLQNEFNLLITRTFGKDCQIFATGFSDFKQPEYEFLSYFNNSQIPFALSLDYSDENGPLFGNFQEVIQKFIQVGYNIYSDEKLFENYSQEDYDQDSYFLRKYLFNYNSEKINQNLENYIRIFEVLNIDEEVKYVAKLVKHLNTEKGIDFEDIAIVSKKAEDYSGKFREAFRKERIPVNISDRQNLWNSGIVNSLMNLINLKFEFNIEMIHKVISGKFIKLAEDVDIDNILKISKILRINSFIYKIRSDYILEKAKQYFLFVESKLKETLDKYEKKKYLNLANELKLFLEDFGILQNSFNQISEKITANEFRDLVLGLIDDFKVKESLIEKNKELLKLNPPANQYDYFTLLESIEKENQALDKFIELCKNIALTFDMRFSEQKFELKDWFERLQIAVSSERFQIKEKNRYGVSITSLEQIRMLPYKVKILCGLNDGVFPTVYSGEQILGRELKDAKRRHIRSERIIFYQFLSNENMLFKENNQEIYLFYNTKRNGESQSPSAFIENLIKISNLQNAGRFLNINNLKKSKKLDDNELIWINSITQKSELLSLLINEKHKFQEKFNDSELYEESQKFIDLNEFEFLYQINSSKKNIEKIFLEPVQIEDLINHHYSISEIEQFAACPYKYFTNRILSIDQPEEVEDELSNLEKGNFIHSVFYKFYVKLKEKNLDTIELIFLDEKNRERKLYPQKLNPKKFQYYKNLLFEIIETELKNPVYDHPFIHLETKNYLKDDSNKNHLLKWLKNEISKIEVGWEFYPIYFEYSTSNSILQRDENGEITDQMYFHIKTDKVEISHQDNTNYISIIDYKLGSSSVVKNGKIINKFKSFQMPLYLAVIQREFENNGIKVEPAFGAYNFIVRKSSDSAPFNISFVLIHDVELIPVDLRMKSKATSQYLSNLTTQEAIQNSINKVFEIRNEIVKGNFQLTENFQDACKFCDYDSLCRRRLFS